jgi:transcriptional regulator with XRE-family HTH domain
LKNLRELRESCLLTQGEVQGQTGIQASTLSKIENAIHIPRAETLRKLADCYDVDYSDILDALAQTREGLLV